MSALALQIAPELSGDASTIGRLHARAFGPGRFARAAFRLREGGGFDARLSFVARVGTLVTGSVRVSAITIGGEPALALGPLAVEPEFRRHGIGGALMQASIVAARARGHGLMILIGDEPYYGRFGFRRVTLGQIELPGPADPARVLALELRDGALAAAKGLARAA